MVKKTALYIDVYGCTFRLQGDRSSAVHMVAQDFQFFICDKVFQPIEMELVTKKPPYHEVPEGVATTYTPRNVSFTKNAVTYIDYSGEALAIWERKRMRFRLFTTNPDLQYEAAYLFILSRIGECLDGRKIHRIHAMAMSVQGRAVLAVLPMGGGKSTLTSGLLSYPEFHFLSDDSPFISENGNIHAFPLRLGFLPGCEKDIPAKMRRTINRMEFGPKVVVNFDYIADRVEPTAVPGIVFLGKRSLSSQCRIEPACTREAFMSMMTNCVVGVGLFQGLEFVLSHSPIELVTKANIARSRFQNARKLFARSQVYRLILGRNPKHNAETVRQFVQSHLGRLA